MDVQFGMSERVLYRCTLRYCRCESLISQGFHRCDGLRTLVLLLEGWLVFEVGHGDDVSDVLSCLSQETSQMITIFSKLIVADFATAPSPATSRTKHSPTSLAFLHAS